MERYNEKPSDGPKSFILSYSVTMFNYSVPQWLAGIGGRLLGEELAKKFDIEPGIWTNQETHKSSSRKLTVAELLTILPTDANERLHKLNMLIK